jgi:hypothetical protein
MYTRTFEGKRAGAGGRMGGDQGLFKRPVSCWIGRLCCAEARSVYGGCAVTRGSRKGNRAVMKGLGVGG